MIPYTLSRDLFPINSVKNKNIVKSRKKPQEKKIYEVIKKKRKEKKNN